MCEWSKGKERRGLKPGGTYTDKYIMALKMHAFAGGKTGLKSWCASEEWKPRAPSGWWHCDIAEMEGRRLVLPSPQLVNGSDAAQAISEKRYGALRFES